jgi:hypothetical protein
MDVFGPRWSRYMERLETEWKAIVTSEDTVLLPGDISWATYLEEAYKDFAFLEQLPGKKIISKGNHDYWWTTLSKLEKFLALHEFRSISFLHNNSYKLGENVICGARGWKVPGDDDFSAEDRKIYNRELQRLELSIRNAAAGPGENVLVAMHYPPISPKGDLSGFMEIMLAHGVKTCIYGHLHGEAHKRAFEGNINGIDIRFVSADFLGFRPKLLFE